MSVDFEKSEGNLMAEQIRAKFSGPTSMAELALFMRDFSYEKVITNPGENPPSVTFVFHDRSYSKVIFMGMNKVCIECGVIEVRHPVPESRSLH